MCLSLWISRGCSLPRLLLAVPPGSQGGAGIIQLDEKHSVGWDTHSAHTPFAFAGGSSPQHLPSLCPCSQITSIPSGLLSVSQAADEMRGDV